LAALDENRDTLGALKLRLDDALCCVSSSPDPTKLFSGSATSLVGKYFPELFAPTETRLITETLRSSIEEGLGALIVASCVEGETSRSIELRVSAISGSVADGALLEITARDVRDRPQSSVPLSGRDPSADGSSAERLAAELRDGLCEIGEDGRVLYANPSYVALMGLSPAVVVGSDPMAHVHPDDRRRAAQMFRPGARARRRGALVYRAQSSVGRVLDLEATAQQFDTIEGRQRVVLSIRDVTERESVRCTLERHIQLETHVAELSRFFIEVENESIQAGIVSRLASVARLADAQHSWLYSFATRDKEIEFFDWWEEEDATRKPAPASNSISAFPHSTGLIRSGRVYQVTDVDALPPEAASERQDMIDRGVQSILGIPIMSSGHFVGFLGFESFDREVNWPEETIMLLRMVGEIFYSALRRRKALEDLHQSESQLLQSQKMEAVGTLAGGIAHDFNNHLAVMLANARFVRQEVEADDEVVAAIKDFERSADHCAQLTRSLLTFSRRSPVEVVPVEVARLVEGVEDLVRPLLPSSIDFEAVLMPDLGSFAVDTVQIQQVLVNLLVNARDAMPEGGPVRLEVCRRAVSTAEAAAEGLSESREYVVLSVTDAGEGMDVETQGRVFEPFFTTKPLGHGTGLGLAMVYGIVRQSQGSISVESQLGSGSTFRIYLPGVISAQRSKR
jgi:PAS domain S-box-containing protein